MRILITGGTGLVGTPLVQALIARKYQVVVLSRSPQKVYSRFCSAAENLNSLNDITHLNDIDAVINLAGEPIADKRWSEEQKKLLCESRWQITERLSELINASETPPAVFLSGSAVGWYGDQGQSVVTEDDEPNQEFTHTLCDRWESLAMKAQSEKTRVCLLRTGIVLSPEGGALAKLLPVYRAGLGGPIGNGRQYMPWIHISDMVSAILFLLDDPAQNGPFNMTAPYPSHNEQFTAVLAQILHRPHLLRVPAFVVKALMGEAAVLVLGGQNALPKRLEEAGFGCQFINLEEALRDLLDSPADY
ncbi:TPA: TIGR01777 family oxidoreductase [Morganella morganii]|uniref:TIGR01777 family oxidoreductase n=1 Tax=Morganella morganii TaxID=582 RepID=UPI0007DB8AA3|nr:TIGR01777 family oxidoreductase [Morganella morganii]EME8469789.1 TIGR01777 family oxidoreductase [Morganella morganii]MBT0347700.1 TIGR01777 family protein [Morganella morganii subsp. morganii]MDF5911791.1 TIGR01777 family oxidoreductase [Morganella morganii]NGE92976.1 TIGR01777 family protein [Morganella morganii]OAR97127.1 epimerase [Morganella morganii]